LSKKLSGNILITGYGSSIAGIRHTHLQERSRSMLRNKGFQMIVGAIVITGVIIAWLMLGGEAPSNNPVQKESSGANAKVGIVLWPEKWTVRKSGNLLLKKLNRSKAAVRLF
jgi:hypothetical protein